METWLTYLAALLMAGATAFTFSSSAVLAKASAVATAYVTDIAALLFLPIMVITFAAGTASLRKDRLGRKSLSLTILWAVITSVFMALCAMLATHFYPQVFPTSSSAGGVLQEVTDSYIAAHEPMGLTASVIKLFIPAFFGAWILGAALNPTSDVIRPAYAVANSFSEVMYRVERTITFFGCVYVYVAGTSFFLSIWQEKTAIAAPGAFLALALATITLVLVVLPILYGFFIGFKRNPYGIVGRSLASMFVGLTSSNIYASALVNESVSRCNLGTQKRISSTVIPVSVFLTRGGTAFVSTATVLTLLQTLGAGLTLKSATIIALATVLISFTSSAYAGYEVVMVSTLVLKMLHIESYGSTAAIIALLPILNGTAILLDSLLCNMAASIVSVRTKTDAKIPLQDTI